MNQTHAAVEVKPLANGSDVLDRLMHLWATKQYVGFSTSSQHEEYLLRGDSNMIAAIPDAGDRIIELEKQLAETRKLLDAALHELAYGTHTMAQQFNRESP